MTTPTTGGDPHTAPELDRSALVVIDTQVDFCNGGASPVPGTTDVLPTIGQLLAAYRRAQLPIIHVVRLYDGDDVDLARRSAIAAGAPIVRPGSTGSQITPTLLKDHTDPLHPATLLAGHLQQLAEREWAMWKPRWNAFHRTLSMTTSTGKASPPSCSPDATTPIAPAPPSTEPANATTGCCSSTMPSPGYSPTTSRKPPSSASATPPPHTPPPHSPVP